MRSARDRLSQHRSVKASIVERVDIGDRRMMARGRFFSGEFPRTRIEFETQIGDSAGSLLEICDGQILYIQRTIRPVRSAAAEEIGAKPVVEWVRRDVQQILRASASGQDTSLPMHAADLGLGGLSAVLASLERSMVFESVRQEDHAGRTYHVLEGRWKPQHRDEVLSKLGGSAQALAPFLPDRVRVDLEAETLFPVRILYLKLTSTERQAYRPMVSLELRDVEFDVDLPDSTFEFKKPEGVEPEDDTRDYVRLLQGSQAPAGNDPATRAP